LAAEDSVLHSIRKKLKLIKYGKKEESNDNKKSQVNLLGMAQCSAFTYYAKIHTLSSFSSIVFKQTRT